nr:TonB-dependent receptor [Salinimonas marina]
MAHAQSDIEVIQITGNQDEQISLNPGAGKAGNLFGKDMAVSDIPRAMTSLSDEALTRYNIASLHDIARVAPNTYASSGFGTPSLPSMRGQLGELFQDGIRRQAGNNGFGLPFSFNSVAQMDIVKGPPMVLLGSTQRNGGFVNIQSKTADLNHNRGLAQISAGRWDRYTASVDYSYVLNPGTTALRMSTQWIDANSFYQNASEQSENVFVTLRHRFNPATLWDVSVEYFDARYPDIAGINRPTQALIDDNLYITGQGRQPGGNTIPGPGAIVSPEGQQRIDRSNVLTHPDDINSANTTIVRSRMESALSPYLQLRNISYYQHLEREEIATNSFVEIIDGAHTVQNRLELDIELNQQQTTTVGLDLRYNDVLGYSQFTTEADNPIDLTGPLSARLIPLSLAQQQRLVALREGVLVSPGAQYDINNDGQGDFNLSDTTDSTTWQTGLAVQQQSDWSSRFSTIVGVRADYYDVSAKDALPPAGVAPASDNFNTWLYSAQLNATYAITPSLNVYAAYSNNDATSNSMAGGTVLGADNQISEANFNTQNTLYEAGLKYAPDEALYAELAIFEQTRSLRNRDGSNTGIRTNGFELQAFYQGPDYWLNASYSYLDAQYDDSAAFQGTGQVADVFDNSAPELIRGTGVGSPSFTAFAPSDSKVQGVVPQLFAINGGWHITPAVELGSSFTYTKAFPLDFLQTVFIRDQIRWDLNASYQLSQNLQFRFDVVNVTDEDNWQPVFEGGFFGADLVMPELPRHAKVTMRYAF